jgi:hypothetical protein
VLALLLPAAVVGAALVAARILETATEKFYHSHRDSTAEVANLLLTGRLACPYCKGAIVPEDAIVSCRECKTLHHYECWEDLAICAVFGCECTRRSFFEA